MHKTSSIFIRTSPHNAKRPAINTRSLIIDDSISCRHNKKRKKPVGTSWLGARRYNFMFYIYSPTPVLIATTSICCVYIFFYSRLIYIFPVLAEHATTDGSISDFFFSFLSVHQIRPDDWNYRNLYRARHSTAAANPSLLLVARSLHHSSR